MTRRRAHARAKRQRRAPPHTACAPRIAGGGSTAGQAVLNQGVDLRELAGLVSGGDRRLPRLVVVPGLTDLAFDLYAASGDPLNDMTALLAEDLVKIRAGVVATCGSEDRFNALIAEYIRAAADNYRNAVSSETARPARPPAALGAGALLGSPRARCIWMGCGRGGLSCAQLWTTRKF